MDRSSYLSDREQRSLRDRQSVMLFGVVYAVFFCIFLVVLVIAANIWTIDAYAWGGFGVIFGPAVLASAVSMCWYAWATWHLGPDH